MPYWRLSGYYFFYFAFIGAFSPYFGLYFRSLAFSAWQIGVLMSLMQVMRIVAPYLWGWLADRRGARLPIVRLAGLASLAGFSGVFFTAEFAGLFAALAVMAFFWGAALPLVESTTLGHLAERPAGYGQIRLWGSIGFLATVLGVGYVLDVVSLAALPAIAAGLLAGILVFAVLVPEAPAPAVHGPVPTLAPVLARREVRGLFAACFLMSAAHGALYVFYSILLVEHGYSKTWVGWMWTLGVLAEIAVFLAAPRLFARFSLRTVLLASFACAVLRFPLIGWGAGSVVLVVAAQLLHGATFGAYHLAAIGAVQRWFPGRLQARGQALYSSVSFGAGGMLGGVLSGLTWDTLGAELTYTISAAFALLGGWMLARTWPVRAGEHGAPERA